MSFNNLVTKLKYNNRYFLSFSKTNSYKTICLTVISILFVGMFLITLFYTGLSFKTNPKEWIENNTLLRTLCATMVGFGLSVAGCGMQGATRNDLSGPTTMGLLPAATFGILVAEAVGLNKVHFIFIFGLISCLIVLVINFATTKIKGYSTDNFKTILVGLILGALLTSAGIVLKTIFPIITETMVVWIGNVNFNNYSWERFCYSAPSILIGCILVFSVQNKLNIIEKDISLATSLGINIKAVYWVVGIAAVLISISSILLLGSVVIVGIVIPHICRMLMRTRDYKWIIPTSGLLTALILNFATLMNILFQLGITLFTVVIFVPIFILMIFRKKGGS